MRKYFLNYCCVEKKKDNYIRRVRFNCCTTLHVAITAWLQLDLYSSAAMPTYRHLQRTLMGPHPLMTCSMTYGGSAPVAATAAAARSLNRPRRLPPQLLSESIKQGESLVAPPFPATLKIMLSKIGQIFVTVLSLLYRAQKHCRFSLQFSHIFKIFITRWTELNSVLELLSRHRWRHNDHVERQVARGTTRAFA